MLGGAGTQVRHEVTRERLVARAAVPGRQGLGTAVPPRLPHASHPHPANAAPSLPRPDSGTNPASVTPSFAPRRPPRGAVSTLERTEGGDPSTKATVGPGPRASCPRTAAFPAVPEARTPRPPAHPPPTRPKGLKPTSPPLRPGTSGPSLNRPQPRVQTPGGSYVQRPLAPLRRPTPHWRLPRPPAPLGPRGGWKTTFPTISRSAPPRACAVRTRVTSGPGSGRSSQPSGNGVS